MEKNQRPLFEIIREGRQKKGLASWLKRLTDGSDDPHPRAPAAEGGSGAGSPMPPAPPTDQAAAPPPADEASAARQNMMAWARRPVGFRLPMGLLVALGAAVVVLVVVVFMVAMQLGKTKAIQQEQAYETAVAPIRAVQEQQPVKPLIPATVQGVEKQAALPPGKTVTAGGEASDPRQPGLNYFRLTVLPGSAREEALRAVTYLKASGVDATVVPVNNGGSLKLVALRGFAKPLSDAEATVYKSQLQSLGRKWKAQNKGSSDWKDMFPEKYKPGVN